MLYIINKTKYSGMHCRGKSLHNLCVMVPVVHELLIPLTQDGSHVLDMLYTIPIV